jgi:hypothetical protein
MKNRTYNVLKFVALVVLPAIGTLYFTVAGIWGLPHADQVVGTITAIDTFLGAILAISSKVYKPPTDGQLNIYKSPDKDVYTLDVTTHPEDMAAKSHILLAVNPTTPPSVPDGPAMPS